MYFTASLALAYRITLWTRLASRIVLVIYKGSCESAEQLYNAAYCVDWPAHTFPIKALLVSISMVRVVFLIIKFGALKIKDAIVDRFRDDDIERPNVSRVDAEFKVDAHFRNGVITIAMNFSGPSLHQRGYRSTTGEAPLKEKLSR